MPEKSDRIHTFDAMLSATGNLAQHDLALEWAEHNHAEFDCQRVSIERRSDEMHLTYHSH